MANSVLEILKRARRCELEISPQIEHVERLQRIARTVKGSRAYCETMLEKLAKLETEINVQIDKAVDAKRDALVYINKLSGEERGVIESYYILAKNWDQIAVDLYMSERRVYLIRKKALEKLNNIKREA